MQKRPKMLAASFLALSLLATAAASAQIKRTPVLKADVAAPGHEAVVVRAVHGARNPGREPLRFVGVYVVEKGKPLITPAK